MVTAGAPDGTFEADLPSEGDYYVTVFQGPQQLYGNVVSVTATEPVLLGIASNGRQVCKPPNSEAPQATPGGSSPSIFDPQHVFQKTHPAGLVQLSSGLVILDDAGKRLLQARSTGLVVLPTGSLSAPLDIAAAKTNAKEIILLISAFAQQSRLTAYTTDGTVWSWWPTMVPGRFTAISNDPTSVYLGITTDASFDIMQLSIPSVLDKVPNAFSSVMSISNNVSGGPMSGPLAVDTEQKRIFIVGMSGGIFRADLARPNAPLVEIVSPKHLGEPSAMLCDSANRILYVGAGSHLWAVNLTSSPAQVSELAHHRLKSVTALALTNHGVWVGDAEAHTIYFLSSNHQQLQPVITR